MTTIVDGSPDCEGDSQGITKGSTFISRKSPPLIFLFAPYFCIFPSPEYMIMSIKDNIQLECGGRVCIYETMILMLHYAYSFIFLISSVLVFLLIYLEKFHYMFFILLSL